MPRKSRPPASSNTGRAPTAQGARVRSVQTPKAPTGMKYGAHQETISSQRAMPLPQAPSPGASPTGNPAVSAGQGGAPGGGAASALAAAMGMPPPGPGLAAESNRPGEPLSHGAPFGPGAGPEILDMGSPGGVAGDVRARMHALYRHYPLPEIAELLAEMSD